MGSTSDADDELRSRVRQQEVVAELGHRALETTDLDRLLRDACVVAAETLDVEYATMLELRPDGEEARLRQGVGWRDGQVGTATVPTDLDSQPGYTLVSDEPIIVDDLRTETRFSGSELFIDEGVVSGISVIVGSIEEPWGVLGMHATERREFTVHDANFVQSVANVLASAIDRATKERKLARYKEYTTEILAGVDDIFYVVDEAGAFQRWNDSLNTVTGYTDAEIRSMSPLELVTEADREAIANGITTVFDAGSARVEATVRTEDGDEIPYEFVACALENPEGDRVLAGIGRDISERKAREEELAKYETIVETIDDGIYVKDDENRFTVVNDAYAELTGYDREELVGAHASLVVDEATIEEAVSRREASTEGDATDAAMEAMVETADGESVPAEGTFATIRLDDGRREQIGVVRDITERKEAEEKLRKSEERFRNLMERSPFSIQIFDAEGRTVAANSAWERLWNAPKEELADYNILDDEQLAAAGVLSDIRKAFRGEDVTLPITHYDPAEIGKPGRDRWIEGYAYPLLAEDEGAFEVALVHYDITERKAREQELERYETAVETVWDGITVLDSDDRFALVNDAFCDITGYDREEVIGDRAARILDESTDERVGTLYDEAFDRDRDVATLEYDFVTAADETVPVEARFGPIEYADGTVGRAGVIRDVTDRKRRERALEESNERLEQFAYAASHDLQEPLRMVSSYLQLIERRYADDLDAEATEFLEFAVDGADRMRTMIHGLLDYSRVETQGEPLGPVELDVALEGALENLRMRIEESDAEITAEALPLVEGDEQQLQQVFQNLLANAIEYSGDDPPRIDVSAARRDGRWLISVHDEGVGIAPDHQERIFEVFQRLHTADEHAGSGIGLALCERIVDRHGGDLRVESTPGEGSTFSFTLQAA